VIPAVPDKARQDDRTVQKLENSGRLGSPPTRQGRYVETPGRLYASQSWPLSSERGIGRIGGDQLWNFPSALEALEIPISPSLLIFILHDFFIAHSHAEMQ